MKKATMFFGIYALVWVSVIFMSLTDVQSQALYVPDGLYGIGTSTTSNVGVGVSAPLSKLAVGSVGSASYAGYFYNPTAVNSYCIGLGAQAVINSGSFNKGIYGVSYSNTALSTARAYGVQGLAGNATSGWNYGIYGILQGSNNGAAVYGTVIDTYSGDENTGGQYAGYFKGNVYMSTQLSIGYKTASYMLDVNGTIRATDIITTSDERLKENVKELKGSLASLSNLRGVSYSLKTGGISALSKKDKSQTAVPDTGKVKTISSYTIDPTSYNRTHIGFLAQEVQKVFPELVHTDADGIMSVNYISLIPVLVESIKELDARTTELQNLKNQIAELESKLGQCCTASATKSSESASTTASMQSNAILYQNTPNPFNQNTTIAYYLPETVSKASLQIYNMQGSQIKVVTVTDRGNGSVVINSGELKAGMYMYTLLADGKEVGTRRMILTD